MKTNLKSRNAPALVPLPYQAEESEDIMGLVRELIDGDQPGLLSTVDEQGFPRTRWMSTLACQDFPYLYTLTAPSSRKVAQLQARPRVSWTFFNRDLTLVVNLTGRATVLTDAKTVKRVWNQVRDKHHAYFLQNCAEGPSTAVICTRVERVECTTPQNYMHFQINPEEIKED
ncbi:General stress protein 26 [Verrucomicrobium sp. GAS474]|uniref:pyridoxamine 5'-phosphate oxidase family protein n=1 Tax=Verrucomicrobium sp. GAS474 TaxID=1882831 RepID=UPI00087ABD5A|nr:pyridoxamine 5'-phosphate oxidase family protein [Verrucomicrobium sp. GAS474]SDU00313.1 General stress protein 26 [Verrucomicrobium sp. GAS474]